MSFRIQGVWPIHFFYFGNYFPSDKLVFFDVIIEDDSGETEEPEEIVPYQLSQEALVMDVKVKDIKVHYYL